jgi:hypothetical protein
MMPLNPILVIEIFDCWGIDFMGPFPPSFGFFFFFFIKCKKFIDQKRKLENQQYKVYIQMLTRKGTGSLELEARGTGSHTT